MFVGTRSPDDGNYVYVYDQISDQWSAVPQSITFDKSFAKTPAITDDIQDVVYIWGQATDFHMHIYDLTTNSWNQTNITTTDRPVLYAVVVLNGEILYIGGVDQPMNRVTIIISPSLDIQYILCI